MRCISLIVEATPHGKYMMTNHIMNHLQIKNKAAINNATKKTAPEDTIHHQMIRHVK